jgi:hypothetical protein
MKHKLNSLRGHSVTDALYPMLAGKFQPHDVPLTSGQCLALPASSDFIRLDLAPLRALRVLSWACCLKGVVEGGLAAQSVLLSAWRTRHAHGSLVLQACALRTSDNRLRAHGSFAWKVGTAASCNHLPARYSHNVVSYWDFPRKAALALLPYTSPLAGGYRLIHSTRRAEYNPGTALNSAQQHVHVSYNYSLRLVPTTLKYHARICAFYLCNNILFIKPLFFYYLGACAERQPRERCSS